MKKIMFITIFITINMLVFAQNINFKYYSSIQDGDYESGFSGYAVAIYITEQEMPEIEQKISTIGRKVNKITRNNSWLCWKALNEWELLNNENYLIICSDSLIAEEGLLIIATIQENGDSFSWRGAVVNNEDLN